MSRTFVCEYRACIIVDGGFKLIMGLSLSHTGTINQDLVKWSPVDRRENSPRAARFGEISSPSILNDVIRSTNVKT